MRTVSRLLLALAPPILAAAAGGKAAQVYARLDKPRWAPPVGVFGPVWSVLYVLIGAAGWRVLKRPDPAAISLHLAQLGLNASWTPLFFAAGRRRFALAISVLLDAAVAAEMIVAARNDDQVAAALLAPYLAWGGYATALTAVVSDPS